MKNRNKDHLIGRGEMFFPFFLAQIQQQKGDHGQCIRRQEGVASDHNT